MDTSDLRAWRARRRWTQEQAADALGYSRRGFQDAELREGPIAQRLADAVTAFEASETRPRPQSLENTTLGDLSDEENIKQCAYELERALTDSALADWARRWGRATIAELRSLGRSAALDEATTAANEAEEALGRIKSCAEELVAAFDSHWPENLDVPKPIESAIALLEGRL